MKKRILKILASTLLWQLITAPTCALLGRRQTFSIVHSFGILTNVTGAYSQCALVQGINGALYGTASTAEGLEPRQSHAWTRS